MIKCPNCGKQNVISMETRLAPMNRMRRRKICRECGYRFTIYEVYIPDGDDPREHWKEFMKWGYKK